MRGQRQAREITLGAGEDLAPVTAALAAAVRAGGADTVEIRCPGSHDKGVGGPVLGMVSAGPGGAYVVAIRVQPDPFLTTDLARLARRRWPERNPKVPDATYGATWVLEDMPPAVDFRCHRCPFRGWLDRDEIMAAHRNPRVRVVPPHPHNTG
ncbi:MAG: hypothetical protein M3404_08665 [Actinomycetota bacterium]|nr:hypothetical protein [Actinomycetota bacterium]